LRQRWSKFEPRVSRAVLALHVALIPFPASQPCTDPLAALRISDKLQQDSGHLEIGG